MLNADQIHYCKVMNYSAERAEEVLKGAVILAMFGDLTNADEAFIEFNRTCERAEEKQTDMNFLKGTEFAVDFLHNGKTYTVLHFEDEVGPCTLTATETGLNTEVLTLKEEQRVRDVLSLNRASSIQPDSVNYVSFERVFFSQKDYISESELRNMVSQTIEIPENKVCDNGHCRGEFRAILVRESGHGSYIPEDSKGITRNNVYRTGYANLYIRWELIEPTFVVYNRIETTYTQPWTETVRNFIALTEEERTLINNSLTGRFEE